MIRTSTYRCGSEFTLSIRSDKQVEGYSLECHRYVSRMSYSAVFRGQQRNLEVHYKNIHKGRPLV